MDRRDKLNAALGERIRYLREDVLEMSQEVFAQGVGVSRGAVGNWELGKGAKRESLLAIANAYGASFEWLASGRGVRPLRGEDQGDAPAATMGSETGLRGLPAGASPQIDVTAGMGGGGLTLVSEGVPGRRGMTFAAEHIRDFWRLPPSLLSALGLQSGDIAIFQVQGDSMQPTLNEGDHVFVDTRHRWPSPDGLYALADMFGGIVVKRLEVEGAVRPFEGDDTASAGFAEDAPSAYGEAGGFGDAPQVLSPARLPADPADIRIRVISDNPRHPPRSQTLEETRIIGRVVRKFGVVG
ncbi:MAG: S24 family peptidase [Flavobacteriaceae bacterium]